MISDSIKNLDRYLYVPNVQKAVDFIKENDLASVEIGKYDLGDDCTLKVVEYVTQEEPEEVLLEAHREYLDLQLLVKGSETFLFQAIDLGEEATEYNKQKDVEFFTAPYYNSVVLNGENFALVFPNDLHTGNVVAGEEETVKKFVFKLKI